MMDLFLQGLSLVYATCAIAAETVGGSGITWQDFTNGVFEALAGWFVLVNCRRVLLDRQVAGVSVWATAFFASWSVWNLYFYPSLGQWLSFAGGLVVGVGNIAYVALLVRFSRRTPNNGPDTELPRTMTPG